MTNTPLTDERLSEWEKAGGPRLSAVIAEVRRLREEVKRMGNIVAVYKTTDPGATRNELLRSFNA